VRETGWQLSRVEAIGDALVYSQYNIVIRHIVKLNATRSRPTDRHVSNDDFTDWDAVEVCAREFVEARTGTRVISRRSSPLTPAKEEPSTPRSGGPRAVAPRANRFSQPPCCY
jgi:hypothetical protein